MNFKFNERLNEIMKENEVTTKQLSNVTGISIQSIYNWKKGESYKIYLNNLIKICDSLKCSIEFIVGRTETILDFTPQFCPPFYERLRQVMEEKGKTRYRIVQDTKLYDNYFTVWKRGHEPQLDTLIQLAEYLDCTLDYLVGRDR